MPNMSANNHTTRWAALRMLEELGLPATPENEQTATTALKRYACHAAGIVDFDDSAYRIESMVWRRSDGWEHGGHAQTWEERAEELEPYEKFALDIVEKAQERIGSLGWSESDEEILTLAEKHKVCDVRQVTYDPAKHGFIEEAEPGDKIWFWGIEGVVDNNGKKV